MVKENAQKQMEEQAFTDWKVFFKAALDEGIFNDNLKYQYPELLSIMLSMKEIIKEGQDSKKLEKTLDIFLKDNFLQNIQARAQNIQNILKDSLQEINESYNFFLKAPPSYFKNSNKLKEDKEKFKQLCINYFDQQIDSIKEKQKSIKMKFSNLDTQSNEYKQAVQSLIKQDFTGLNSEQQHRFMENITEKKQWEEEHEENYEYEVKLFNNYQLLSEAKDKNSAKYQELLQERDQLINNYIEQFNERQQAAIDKGRTMQIEQGKKHLVQKKDSGFLVRYELLQSKKEADILDYQICETLRNRLLEAASSRSINSTPLYNNISQLFAFTRSLDATGQGFHQLSRIGDAKIMDIIYPNILGLLKSGQVTLSDLEYTDPQEIRKLSKATLQENWKFSDYLVVEGLNITFKRMMDENKLDGDFTKPEQELLYAISTKNDPAIQEAIEKIESGTKFNQRMARLLIHLPYLQNPTIHGKQILERIDVNIPDENSTTLLHIAARANNKAAVKLLLEGGANVDSLDNNQCSPLHIAIKSNSMEIGKILIEHDADISLQNNEGISPLGLLLGDERKGWLYMWLGASDEKSKDQLTNQLLTCKQVIHDELSNETIKEFQRIPNTLTQIRDQKYGEEFKFGKRSQLYKFCMNTKQTPGQIAQLIDKESKALSFEYVSDNSSKNSSYTSYVNDFLDNAPGELWDRVSKIGRELDHVCLEKVKFSQFRDDIGKVVFILDKLSQSSNKELQAVGEEVGDVLLKSTAERISAGRLQPENRNALRHSPKQVTSSRGTIQR